MCAVLNNKVVLEAVSLFGAQYLPFIVNFQSIYFSLFDTILLTTILHIIIFIIISMILMFLLYVEFEILISKEVVRSSASKFRLAYKRGS